MRNIGSFANLTNMFPDMGATQEMTIDYAAGLGEAPTGGVRVNYMPREGGNTFKVSFFGTGVNSVVPGQQLHGGPEGPRPDARPTRCKKAYDVNGSGGGPIVQGPAVVLRLGAPPVELHATSPACTTT